MPMTSDRNGEIVAQGVSRRFGPVQALDGLTLRVSEGEAVGLVGRSGCGKSTLLRLVAGLDQPDDGRIEVGGARDPKGRLRTCALMPQADLLMPWRDALGNAAIALENAGAGRRRAREQAQAVFAELGLEGFERARTWELSGGMRQRVAFARTLLAGKPVLLLDEPFGALDAITRAEMQDWLAVALADHRHTTLLVTHDLDEALRLCDRVAVLSPRPGTIVAEVRSGEEAGELLRARALEALR
jgi:NitT/TauT family transport system ATP-binding protein